MQLKVIIFIGTFLSAVSAGIFFPSFAAYIPVTPSLCLMGLLYFSFINTSLNQLIADFKTTQKSFYKLIILKLLILPVIVTAFFHMVLPKYALSALLLSGISVASVAPLLLMIVKADLSIATIALVGSSLLTPLTLPVLVKIYTDFTANNLTLNISASDMMISLVIMIVVPFVLAQLTRLWLSRLHHMLQSCSFYLGLIFAFLVNYMILADISEFLLANLSIIPNSFFISLLMAIILLLLTFVMTYGEARDQRLTIIICCCGINNMLAVILCTNFFTPLEVVTTVAYIIPFNMLIPVYRFIGWKLENKNT